MPLVTPGISRSGRVLLDGNLYHIDPDSWRRRPITPIVRRAQSADLRWGDLSHWDLKAYQDWQGGMGVLYDRAQPGQYYEGRNTDARFPQTITLSPLKTVAAAALNGTPLSFVLFNDNGTTKLFLASGTKVYAWDAATNDWVDDVAGAAATITDILVYNNVLYVAQGATAAREKTGGAWAAVTNNWTAKKLAIGVNKLGEWSLFRSGPTSGTDAHQYSFSTNGDTWSTYLSVGDSSAQITRLLFTIGRMWMFKEDGVYANSDDDRPRLMMPFLSQKSSTNFDSAIVWHTNEIFANALYGVWRGDGQRFQYIGQDVHGDGLASDRWGRIISMLPTVKY